MKKIIKYMIISVFCVLFCSGQCSMEPTSYSISVHNNSDHYIDVLISYGDPIYPDTLLPNRFYNRLNPVKPGLARRDHPTLNYKEEIQSYGSDTIIIFIFHTDTLAKYTWDEVRAGYKILKRYDVSWQEMEALKGEISYPPTEAMKSMKMYPPYSSE